MIMLYTDGSSLTPNGIGAWAYVLVAQIPKDQFATTRPIGVELAASACARTDVTNNQMEMLAIMHGLKHATKFDCTRGVTVISDSKYALQGITDWRDGWERRGMRTAAGQPVKNADMWQGVWKSVDACQSFPVIFEHVRGHRGIYWNEYVDDLARNAALSLKEEQLNLHDSRH